MIIKKKKTTIKMSKKKKSKIALRKKKKNQEIYNQKKRMNHKKWKINNKANLNQMYNLKPINYNYN